MADLYTQTPVNLFPWLAFRPQTFLDVQLQFFLDRAPMQGYLPKESINADKFTMVGYSFRPRRTAVTAAALATDTTISVGDASIYMNGDVLKVSSSGEILEIIATPNIVANTIMVLRGRGLGPDGVTYVDGATAPASIVGDTTANVFNIGNSRTGGEKFQAGISQIPKGRSQNVQTFQHVVSVSGLFQAVGNALREPDADGPLPANKMRAMQALSDDVEVSSLIGIGEELGVNGVTRSKQHGLFNILQTTNLGVGGPGLGYSGAPRNPTVYKPTDLEADLFEPIRAGGGQPGLLMVSSKFRTGLTQWGGPLQLIAPASTSFGVPIKTYYSSSVPEGIPIVENFWFDQCFPGTATIVCMTRDQIKYRVLEALDYKEYGRSGDTGINGEGDWIERLGLQVNNEQMHGAVRGITGFARQT